MTALMLLAIAAAAQPVPARTFTLCQTGGGINCVVDGDTLWLDGVKVRISDIDTPETHQPKCPAELALGKRATQRMIALVNAGAFELAREGRDEDRGRRKLRVLKRDGRSFGDVLISEGLARKWDGKRRSWC
jgi:micrococcal nuclease